MKPPQSVLQVLDKPGIYRFDEHAFYWYFEVDTDGIVHQLNPRTMERDGVLRANRWTVSARYGKVTPCKRVLDSGE